MASDGVINFPYLRDATLIDKSPQYVWPSNLCKACAAELPLALDSRPTTRRHE
jgi:hypothetical protein